MSSYATELLTRGNAMLQSYMNQGRIGQQEAQMLGGMFQQNINGLDQELLRSYPKEIDGNIINNVIEGVFKNGIASIRASQMQQPQYGGFPQQQPIMGYQQPMGFPQQQPMMGMGMQQFPQPQMRQFNQSMFAQQPQGFPQAQFGGFQQPMLAQQPQPSMSIYQDPPDNTPPSQKKSAVVQSVKPSESQATEVGLPLNSFSGEEFIPSKAVNTRRITSEILDGDLVEYEIGEQTVRIMKGTLANTNQQFFSHWDVLGVIDRLNVAMDGKSLRGVIFDLTYPVSHVYASKTTTHEEMSKLINEFKALIKEGGIEVLETIKTKVDSLQKATSELFNNMFIKELNKFITTQYLIPSNNMNTIFFETLDDVLNAYNEGCIPIDGLRLTDTGSKDKFRRRLLTIVTDSIYQFIKTCQITDPLPPATEIADINCLMTIGRIRTPENLIQVTSNDRVIITTIASSAFENRAPVQYLEVPTDILLWHMKTDPSIPATVLIYSKKGTVTLRRFGNSLDNNLVVIN